MQIMIDSLRTQLALLNKYGRNRWCALPLTFFPQRVESVLAHPTEDGCWVSHSIVCDILVF